MLARVKVSLGWYKLIGRFSRDAAHANLRSRRRTRFGTEPSLVANEKSLSVRVPCEFVAYTLD